MFAECRETVSILYALTFGAGDACIDIGVWSLMSAFAAFILIVVILQLLARRLWARLTRVPADNAPRPDAAAGRPLDKPFQDDPTYKDSAIRSSRR